MYFWNVNKLVEDLKLNKVSETDFKNYYIVSAIIILLSSLALTLAPESTVSAAWASFILQIGLLEKGRDFLKRIIALSLPITIQSLVLFLIVGISLQVIILVFASSLEEAMLKQLNIVLDLIFEVIISTYIYWRIYVAVKQINQLR